MILILTNEEDVTADYLIEKADQRSIGCFRLNTERLQDKFKYGIGITSQGVEVCLEDVLGRSLTQDDVSGIWYRRPIPPSIAGEQRLSFYAASEYMTLIRCLFPVSHLRWMSHPLSLLAAENKLLQLQLVRELGMSVPRTYVSNSRSFLADRLSRSSDYVIKALQSGRIPSGEEDNLYYTSPLPESDPLSDEVLACSPTIIQERVRKAYDVRLTVIDLQCFAAKIECEELDWRQASNRGRARFTPMETPEPISVQSISLLKRLNVTFGALDFAVDEQGVWYFLEINPNGQWAWLDPYFGGRIADAILTYLSGKPLL